MKELSLHILDLSMNSVRANCKELKVEIEENSSKDSIVIKIDDDGDGMEKEFLEKVIDPFTTTRTTRKVGLGIPLMKANAEACEGDLEISSETGVGTKLSAKFKLSHIDRPIMGDIASVMCMLYCSHPEINVVFKYRVNSNEFSLSSKEINQELEGLPINTPEVRLMIEDILKAELAELNFSA